MDRKIILNEFEQWCDSMNEDCPVVCLDALELLKNDEEQTRRKLQHIADSQLAIGGADPLTDYEQGQWDGLELAWEILMEDHSEASYYCEGESHEQKNGLADHHRKTSEEGNSGTQG